MTPFFQATQRSLAYQFTIIAPLLCPPFSNFWKNFHFQPCFGQNFSSQDTNFPNFRSLDPSFFKENLLPRPYFWKPVWHTPTKKKVECPPRGCSQTFQNEGRQGGPRGERGVGVGGADWDSKWWLSIDLCTKCNFIWGGKSPGALTLERGMGMCCGHDPLFSGQSPLPSPPIYRQCAALVTPVFNF